MKKIIQKYFTSSFFLNVPLVASVLIALVTLPIVLANLPVADYGKWQFVLALQTWLLTFSAMNVTFASKRGIAKGLDGTFLYVFLARLKLLFFLGFFVFTAAFYFKISGQSIFSILLLIVGFYLVLGSLSQASFYEFLIAKKRFKEWCFWQILITTISMVGSALVALLTKNIVQFALFQLGSVSVLSWLGCFWIIKKDGLIESYKKGEIDKECVPYGLKLIPVDLVSITATKISHFIIGPFLGFSNLAVFSVANKLRDKAAGVIKSARPMLYADFAKKDRKELIRIINRHLVKMGGLGALLTLGFIGAGWFYIKFFLPESFQQAILYFAILALGLPTGVLSIILHTILEAHLRHKELTVIGIVPNLLKIVLILIFGYFWQIIGVCVALAVSAWISFGFYYLLTVRKDFAIKIVKRFSFLERLPGF